MAVTSTDMMTFTNLLVNYTEQPPKEETEAQKSELNVFGPQYHRNVRIVVLGVMIAASLIGNILVCWRILPSRCRRYPKAKILFLNLAVADLSVTLITMTSQLVWEVMGRIWIAGDAFCRIFKFLQTFSLVSSTYMLVSIAADRHNAIVRPMSRCPTPRSLAIGAWITSLIPSVPCLYIFREVQVENQFYCSSIFYTGLYPPYHRQMFMAFVFLSVFIFPFLLLVGLYTRILVEIWAQSSVFSSSEQTASSLPRAKIKTLKMAIVIFCTFIVTNLPYVIQEMILAFGNPDMLDRSTVALFGVISASNSAMNPYVYLTFHAKGTCTTRFFKVIRAIGCRKCWEAFRIANRPFPLRRQNSFNSGISRTSTKLTVNHTQLIYIHGDAFRAADGLREETSL